MQYEFIETTNADYETYTYPYEVFARKETGDTYAEILAKGFVPTRLEVGYFQLARATRVDLSQFEMSSENRRIARKTENLTLELKSLSDFPYTWEIGAFAKRFYETKFGKGKMSAQKMKWIFTSGAFSDVFIYSAKAVANGSIGYCPILLDKTAIYYAYPFYDLEYKNNNIGIGMMLKAIQYAKEAGKKYIYLGTCYTPSALYKTQFKGFEWFNGKAWSSDIKQLKSLVRAA